MKSAAEVFIAMFGVDTPIRPTKLENIMVSLLYTICTKDLLSTAISDIAKYTDLDWETPEGLEYIKSIVRTPELVGLYNKQKALQLLLKMLPEISVIEEYGKITVDKDVLNGIINRTRKNHMQSEVKKCLKQINSLDLGYKIIQKPKGDHTNDFHVIKYEKLSDIIILLKKYKLQHPSILDKLL